MLNRHPIPAFISILLITALACVVPGVSAPPAASDPNAVNTSIAQEISARQTQAVLNNPATATSTSTPETPTLTLEPTLTPTSAFTATPSTPLISVSVDTNCRTGPGAIFERVGILLVGETAEIVGREPKGEFWYIRNPDDASGFCWVWGEYATVSGDTLPLLYLSPPPPPSAAVNIAFLKMDTCANWWADFRLTNTSGVVFKSISITLTDTDTNPVTTVSQTANGFVNNDGCSTPVVTNTLVAGATTTFSSPQFAFNPKGHKLNAKFTICTEINQAGTCISQEINFKP